MGAEKTQTGMEAKMLNNNDAQLGNERLAIRTLAIEILRQHTGPSIMTMAEAIPEARYVREQRARRLAASTSMRN